MCTNRVSRQLPPAEHAGEALISAVNLQEVVKALLMRGAAIEAAREMIDALYLDIRPHDCEDAYAAAALHAATTIHDSGLGDRSCMALAIREGLPAVTTDRDWSRIGIPGLTVMLAR
jgi:ribonuclease VapC